MMMLQTHIVSTGRMVSNFELGRIWKEVVTEHSATLFQHLHGETEDTRQKLESKKPGCGLRIQTANSKIRSRALTPES
jgi:hypothetical protein